MSDAIGVIPSGKPLVMFTHVRQTVHHGQQNVLVAHHHSRMPSVFVAFVVAQPFVNVSCLGVFRRCGYEGYVLRLAHVGVNLLRVCVELIGEALQIHGDVVSSLGSPCGLVARHVVVVEVPVEVGLAHFSQLCEECLLHTLQEVEANEDVFVVLEVDILLGRHLAVDGTFVAESLLAQPFVVVVVDVGKVAP